MPWCDDCSKFWNPNSMPPDGTCPRCGAIIGEPPDTGVPWHFWLLLGALTLYMGWRVVQGFQWLLENDHAGWAVVAGAALAITTASIVWGWQNFRQDVAGQ